jgi:hypothetical protein
MRMIAAIYARDHEADGCDKSKVQPHRAALSPDINENLFHIDHMIAAPRSKSAA